MPVPPEVRGELGDDHEVPLADLDPAIAARAEIPLAGGIGLDRRDDLYPVSAHNTRAAVTRSVPITMATSTAVLRCWRKGLKPMAAS
jgi:hypothetical protein